MYPEHYFFAPSPALCVAGRALVRAPVPPADTVQQQRVVPHHHPTQRVVLETFGLEPPPDILYRGVGLDVALEVHVAPLADVLVLLTCTEHQGELGRICKGIYFFHVTGLMHIIIFINLFEELKTFGFHHNLDLKDIFFQISVSCAEY